MRTTLAILAIALLALVTPAIALDWSNSNTGAFPSDAKVHGKASRGKFDTWGEVRSMRKSRQADCPNGDCRGLNSPGNLGGNNNF
jgi:hypothetical protein